jgi:NADPH-dependent 2,4-dienoyl-CoA reductase/sulfur reductase-like enzyme
MTERLVVIGADAAGMSAASQARRRRPDLEIVALERGEWTSYAACGIPYLVGGDVASLDDLVALSPQQLRDGKGIDVRMRHEATAIDTDAAEVEVRNLDADRTERIGYDQLMIATGATPMRPPIPGIDGEGVMGVQTLGDADRLLARARESQCEQVVVVGGGYIGLEMAEAFIQWGARVTVIDEAPEVMRTLDPAMGALVRAAMVRHGIEVRCGVQVDGFEPGMVHLGDDPLPADLVVLGMGVVPNSGLAAEAGIPLGVLDSIAVDRRMQSDVDGVWSAGDCAETYDLVSERPIHVALGTVANKGGRVAGINIGGGDAVFPGVVGTAITKLCATEIARTGLIEHECERAGLAFESVVVETSTTAGYWPHAESMTVKMLAEVGTHRLLGAQIVGGDGSAKRIDTVATALTAGMTLPEVIDLDLAYAPPFSPVWDPVQVAARKLEAQLGGNG